MKKNKFSPEALLVLEKYTKWLNLWGKKEETPGWLWTDLTVDEFFKYDSSAIVIDKKFPRELRAIIIIRADYGDDGGPAYLTAHFTQNYNYYTKKTGDYFLNFIVQEFDTMFMTIYGPSEMIDRHGKDYGSRGYSVDDKFIRDEDNG